MSLEELGLPCAHMRRNVIVKLFQIGVWGVEEYERRQEPEKRVVVEKCVSDQKMHQLVLKECSDRSKCAALHVSFVTPFL